MRELLAVQLDLTPSDVHSDADAEGAAGALGLVQEWMARGSGVDLDRLGAAAGQHLTTATGHDLDVSTVGAGDAGPGGWTCEWRRADDGDAGLTWRVAVALGRLPGQEEVSRFSVRIGLERAVEDYQVLPTTHQFGSPAIVRTLLRDYQVRDAGVRVEARYRERRVEDVPALVELLGHPERRLPVLVVTRPFRTDRVVDAAALARELAGLAHVEVLPTQLAARALTDALGNELSVWGGAARLYWPRFSLEDAPRRHRFWTSGYLAQHGDFVGYLRGWLGALSAASVPEHPTVTAVRAEQRLRLAQTDDVPAWVTEYVRTLEAGLDEAKATAAGLSRELAASQQEAEELRAELLEVRKQYRVVAQHGGPGAGGDEAGPDLDSLTVQEAFELARSEAGQHVVYLPDVEDSIADFRSYDSPRRLYAALTVVAEAAAAKFSGGSLGAGFGAYFSDRGYEYSSRNDAATNRRTKASYQRRYDGRVVTMEPHLQVDQKAHPDQCLRIYWYLDQTGQKLVVGHVGRHLPDA